MSRLAPANLQGVVTVLRTSACNFKAIAFLVQAGMTGTTFFFEPFCHSWEKLVLTVGDMVVSVLDVCWLFE